MFSPPGPEPTIAFSQMAFSRMACAVLSTFHREKPMLGVSGENPGTAMHFEGTLTESGPAFSDAALWSIPSGPRI